MGRRGGVFGGHEFLCLYLQYRFHLLTYLLHGAESFLRIGLQLVKKFPAFHGTQRFITALTSVRHLSLSWASPIQSIYLHPTSWRFILILSTHPRLGLPVVSFPPVSPPRPYTPPLLTHTRHMAKRYYLRYRYFQMHRHFQVLYILFSRSTGTPRFAGALRDTGSPYSTDAVRYSYAQCYRH